MAIYMTREEYRKKYGVEPVVPTSNLDTKPSPRMMTRAEYEAEYFPTNKTKVQKVRAGQPAFPAEVGGKGTVVPNIARSFGNLPGATYNLAKLAVSPVNPFDRESPINIGQNLVESAFALKDIYKNRGIKGTKDVAGGAVETGKTGVDLVKRGIGAIKEAGVAGSVSKVAELAINDPTFFPTLIYTPGKVIKGTDAISTVAQPAIKAKGAILPQRSVVEKTADEIANIENNYVATRKANTFADDAGQASRVRIAESNVLNGAVDSEGTIRTLTPGGAVERYRELNLTGKEDVVKNNLLKEGETINLEDVGRELTSAVYRSGLEGADLIQAVNGLKKEIAGLRLRADADGNIPLAAIHDAKIGTTRQINFQTPPETATFRKAKARAYKEIVETNSKVKVNVNGKDYGIKEINRELAKYYDDIARLERLDGRKVKGGKLGKYFAQISGNLIGGAAGAAVGGGAAGMAVGAIAGGEAAGFLKGRMMARTFGNRRDGIASRNPILDVAKAQGKGIDLKVPSKTVVAPKGIAKTKEITAVENDIAKNVASQKAAIKAGDFALVAALKEIYDVLVEKLHALINRIKETPNREGGFADYSYNFGNRNTQYNKTATNNKKPIPKDSTTQAKPYQGEKDITTKILKDLEGKTTVSKQYILDATNRGELKQVERDLVRNILEGEKDVVNVSNFAKKVKAELLPLKRTQSGMTSVDPNHPYYGSASARYENITLPSELRGNVKDYSENIYNSPIKTSAGDVHFGDSYSGVSESKNYFGHTRIEDMADNKTRRVIEVQSDLYQKGKLEVEANPKDLQLARINLSNAKDDLKRAEKFVPERIDSAKKIVEKWQKEVNSLDNPNRQQEIAKLQQYNDPTAHFRMIREEIKKAAQDGKTKLQFPTGETAMKIEGLGDNTSWEMKVGTNKYGEPIYGNPRANELKTGETIIQNGSDEWIITDVLGDGKFKAVPKSNYKMAMDVKNGTVPEDMQKYIETSDLSRKTPEEYIENLKETFDISGKVDTNNPIYKFYEKDVQKYLNKFGGKRVTDDKGVEWIEVPIKKEWAKIPVEAFGVAPFLVDNE